MWIWILRVAKSPLAKQLAAAVLVIVVERLTEDD
jgi:hypothetical protein